MEADGVPRGKYFVVMHPGSLPLLLEAADLDHPFATPEAIDEVQWMSAATVDRYLAAEKTRALTQTRRLDMGS